VIYRIGNRENNNLGIILIFELYEQLAMAFPELLCLFERKLINHHLSDSIPWYATFQLSLECS